MWLTLRSVSGASPAQNPSLQRHSAGGSGYTRSDEAAAPALSYAVCLGDAVGGKSVDIELGKQHDADARCSEAGGGGPTGSLAAERAVGTPQMCAHAVQPAKRLHLRTVLCNRGELS
jgi:hypothetical protein